MHRIVANVSHRDAIRLAMGDIDDIVAGRSHCDHFELRQALQRLGPQRHFVGNGNGCVTQALRQFVRRRDRVLLPPVLESGTSDRRLQCGTVQEYDAMRHAGTRMPWWVRLVSEYPRVCALPLRSEEHTSELQSQSNLVCRLLLEKKKKTNTYTLV